MDDVEISAPELITSILDTARESGTDLGIEQADLDAFRKTGKGKKGVFSTGLSRAFQKLLSGDDNFMSAVMNKRVAQTREKHKSAALQAFELTPEEIKDMALDDVFKHYKTKVDANTARLVDASNASAEIKRQHEEAVKLQGNLQLQNSELTKQRQDLLSAHEREIEKVHIHYAISNGLLSLEPRLNAKAAAYEAGVIQHLHKEYTPQFRNGKVVLADSNNSVISDKNVSKVIEEYLTSVGAISVSHGNAGSGTNTHTIVQAKNDGKRKNIIHQKVLNDMKSK